jgi:hypothetical protein
MSNTADTFKTLVETFAGDHEKFQGGNNAAGTRSRKSLQEIIKLARDTRKAIQEEKNSRKNK